MKRIHLSKPRIEQGENTTSWVCTISGDYINTDLYYSVEKQWGEYLCVDRLDGAVVALLPYIMYRSEPSDPIELVLGAPISEQLFFQLTSELIPALAKECDWYDPFIIKGDTTDDSYNGLGVSTSVSGGVDSFYTLVKSRNEFPERYKVTHGIFCGMKDRVSLNAAEYNNAKEICEEYNIQFVYVESNIVGDVYESRHDAVSSFVIPSISLVLQKLFSIYYHSSSHVYSEFKLDEEGISQADSLLCQCFSTESTRLYTCSMAVTRAEKTEYVSCDEVCQKHLLICGENEAIGGHTKNCSVCSKCTITMIDLDVCGRLNDFNGVFDVKKYYSHPLYYWGYVFYKEKHGLYIDSTLDMVKKKGYKIPIGARLSGLIKIVRHGFRRTNPYQHSFRP